MAITHYNTSEQAREGLRFDPTRVRYSPRWLGAGAAAGVLAVLALRRGGLPLAGVLGAAGLAGAAYATLFEPRMPVMEKIVLRLPDLPAGLEGLRIGQLSDLHLGLRHTAENTTWAVAEMLREQPDIIVLTGDFITYAPAIPRLPALLAPLHAPLGLYAVPGNHDYWEGMEALQELLEPLGIEFLVNSSRRLEWRGTPFWLAGIDDLWEGRHDLPTTLADVPEDAFTILLAHAPDIADEAAEHRIALQLSGHTHGGHLRLPLLGSFCLPRHGTRYAIGHEMIGSMQLYVSRGLGGMPLRLGCPPEATIITLTREA